MRRINAKEKNGRQILNTIGNKHAANTVEFAEARKMQGGEGI
jgi:hypothetical protein